jgi:hypothetical protein
MAYQNDGLSRRGLISSMSAGAFGAAGLSMLNQGLPSLSAESTIPSGSAERVIYIYLSGGMSHVDTFDPKPGHANQGPIGTISTPVAGIQLSDLLPNISRQVKHCAIIRSMNTKVGVHGHADYVMHTSYDPRNTIRHPGIGAWLLKFKGKINENLPGSVFIGGASHVNGGGGFFGPKFEPLVIKKPSNGLLNSRRRGNMSANFFADGIKLMKGFDDDYKEKYLLNNISEHESSFEEALKLMNSKDLEAFDIGKEPPAMASKYGNSEFGQSCLLARRLIESGVRAVEINDGGWDTHYDNFVNVPKKCQGLDQGYSALLDDLHQRGLLKETLVVLCSEFGRTPIINMNKGRDHYPQAFSSVLAGGGIKGGQVYGETSKGAEEVIDKKVNVKKFNATIAHSLGIPLLQPLFSPSMRPFTVADKGKAVLDLFES